MAGWGEWGVLGAEGAPEPEPWLSLGRAVPAPSLTKRCLSGSPSAR